MYDIAIIGYGPVGAALANLMGGQGHKVAVIEKSFEIHDKPRAIGGDHEFMRVMQACGLAEAFSSRVAPYAGSRYLGMDGEPIRIFGMPAPPYPLGWPPGFTYIQPELETILRAGVARYPHVEVMLGYEPISLKAEESTVEIALRSVDGRAGKTIRASYAVACDGANSWTRKELGIGLDDIDFDETWLVIDAWIKDATKFPDINLQYCEPERPMSYVIGPGNLRRWEMKLLPGENAETFRDDDAIKAVNSRHAAPSQYDIWRGAVYRFHALVAQSWKQGRVFLMGDAAHQTPPFMGQGLCAGLRDAANLAWKLSHVLKGRISGAILSTYETERRPHTKTVIEMVKQIGLIVGEMDPVQAAHRDKRLRAELATSERYRHRFIPPLKEGLLMEKNRAAGAIFVQPWVSDGDGKHILLEDLLGQNFLYLTQTPEAQTWIEPHRAFWRRIGGEQALILPPGSSPCAIPDAFCAVECDGVLRDWMRENDATAVIVRPDRYVFAVAATAAEADIILCELERLCPVS